MKIARFFDSIVEARRTEMHKLVRAILATVGLWLLSGPAMAGDPIGLPEPSTIGLFAGGIAAAVIVSRLRKRK